MHPVENILRRIALDDDRGVGATLGGTDTLAAIDARTRTFVHLGALIALSAPTSTLRSTIDRARALGATDEQVLGVLAVVGPVAGRASVVSAAPRVALALGYDVGEDLT